jgi:hypothetical protein
MSSNLESYFVVAYDHVEGKFYVDDNTAANFFNHDTWDNDTDEWVYLDAVDDVPEDMPTLSLKLNNLLNNEQEK